MFILAAVGSAAGLGNVWRFPYLAYENGGAPFFIAYLGCLFLLGFPILLTELALGKKTEKAAPEALASFSGGFFRFLGFWGIFSATVAMSYYAVVTAWAANYLAAAPSLAWGDDPKTYFFHDFLNLSDGIFSTGNLVPSILLGLLAIYAILYFSLFRGISSISKFVAIFTLMPFIFLGILAINGLFLPHAFDGLKFFFLPEISFSALFNIKIWIAAVSQVFFTLTLGLGVMIAYGALLKQKTDLIAAARAVVIGDTIVSIVAGTAIFSTLGFMAAKNGVPVSEVVASGPGLAFVVFPAAISLVPFGAPIFATLFFATLLTLALTSAISLLKAIISAIEDLFPDFSHSKMVLAICLFFVTLSIPFAFQNGLFLLDIVDHFLVNYGLVAVGLFEIIAIAFFFPAEKLRDFINETAKKPIGKWFLFSLKIFIPVVLFSLISTNFFTDISKNYGDYPTRALLFFGIFPAVAALFLALLSAQFLGAQKSQK